VHLVLGERRHRAGHAVGSCRGEDLVADHDVAARPARLQHERVPLPAGGLLLTGPLLADQVQRGLEVVAAPRAEVLHALALQRVPVECELVLQIAGAALGCPDVQVDPALAHGVIVQVRVP
jgi:hypothetical protein